jgi:3-dehydroquinate synthase
MNSTYAMERIKGISKHFAMITDHSVRNLLGNSLQERLKKEGLDVHLFSVEPGETSKSRKQVEILEDQMFQVGLGRDSAIIALGGGVICDLAGFVAATFCRGIPFISIPTTLLAQVDASIGGKVGINIPFGKNLIGAFHPPSLIVIDPETLSTLPANHYRNGMAEVIKYALIASAELFEKLQGDLSIEECIATGCRIKKEVVEKDPKEKGLRRILNFGHTIGHALEAATEYQLHHGEAVALGILAEGYLSYRLGYLQEGKFFQIKRLLEKYRFSLQLPKGLNREKMIYRMALDKKTISNRPRFVLLRDIGEVHPFEGAYCRHVDEVLLEEALQCLE